MENKIAKIKIKINICAEIPRSRKYERKVEV